jgi:adenylate kinase family enzyme
MKTGLVWLIGKPGTGKTTVGEYLSFSHDHVEYYSFSTLLKEFQKEVGEEGFHQETRDKVYKLLADLSGRKLVIVSGNPYTSRSFSDMKKLTPLFSVIHFSAPDALVLERLNSRGREVFTHDGSSQEERLKKFNNNVQPLIEEVIKEIGVTVYVEGKTKEGLADEVISHMLN